MSWLFGRGRSEDEEEYSDEYTDDSQSHSHSSEEEEESDHEEESLHEESDHTEEPSKESNLPENAVEEEPLQNGHEPPKDVNTSDEKVASRLDAEGVDPDQKEIEASIEAKKIETPELEKETQAEGAAAADKPSEPEPENTNETVAEEPESEPEIVEEEEEPHSESAGESTSEKNDGKLVEKRNVDSEQNPADAEPPKEEAPKTDQPNQPDDEKAEDEPEEVTSTHEKRSLLVLAAEHDRVDILKAILADDSEDRDTLLNSSIPPLHISIAFGSTNAVQCLLRMGADPSVRPDIQKIKEQAEAEGEEQFVDIPNMGRFDQLSAWELAFGKSDEEEKEEKKSSGWFGGGSDKKSNSIDIAPSKLEGIRHAFTAEALRCIGSDEVDRLKQLIDSGMPSTIDIGGKNLYDWAVEMGALQCEELLRPAEARRNSNEEAGNENQKPEQSSSAVLDRSTPGTESVSQLSNRIDELKSLSEALSGCLDNLAEEVSVCHGLLLMGGGASALASHVKSLKMLKDNKVAELERLEEAWENSEDELAYWVKECGEAGREIATLMTPAIISSVEGERPTFEGSPEEEQAYRHQLKAEAALLENKIRKLRASITDLSEENTRDLEEVEKRGLSGGIKLVRGLRDEIREIEFTLNETKSAEALCRAKIKLIQSRMGHAKKQSANTAKAGNEAAASAAVSAREENGEASTVVETVTAPVHSKAAPNSSVVKSEESSTGVEAAPDATSSVEEVKPSDKIASGQSSAIALKNNDRQGYFTVDLWRVLLRILGLSSRPVSSQGSSNVMIV